ncbi:unnamed protein product, partial [Candidula unifasciata]
TIGKLPTSKTLGINSDEHSRVSASWTAVKESEIRHFYNKFYATSNPYTVFVDLRKEACPLDMFPRRLLGYIKMSINHCQDLGDATAAAATTVNTWTFDLMSFMTEFLTSVAQPAATERMESSFALFFDESGEDHFLLPSRKGTKKLTFEISLPLINCNDSDQVTNLAAKTNDKDVVVIATAQCIYELLLATSKLHLPPTRFRWLLYATDASDTFSWSGVGRFFDSISPILLTERGVPENRPVFSCSKLLDFTTEAAASFLLDVQNNTTNHDCALDCTSDCSSCQRLFKDHLDT